MILRLSQKLATHVKAGTLAALPLDENPYADWSAHRFVADRTRYVILCNTRSLYSTVFYATGINSDHEFIVRALGALREFMEDDGQQFLYERFIVPTSGAISFGKAFNRSITSSMNDLVYHATMWLTEDNLSPHEVGFKLNDIPFASLATADGQRYVSPREALRSLHP